MYDEESVTRQLNRFLQGDDAAFRKIWEHFSVPLLHRVRRRMKGIPRRLHNEEDILQQAFHSFARRAKNGSFKDLANRDNIWALLVTISHRKLSNADRKETSATSGGKIHWTEDIALDLVTGIDAGCAPDLVVEMDDSLRALAETIPADVLETLYLKLEGYENAEIAHLSGRSLATVGRSLKLIRAKWIELQNC